MIESEVSLILLKGRRGANQKDWPLTRDSKKEIGTILQFRLLQKPAAIATCYVLRNDKLCG